MFLIILGVGFLILGVLTHLGIYKHWWWSVSTPVSPERIVFGAYPIALVCFLVAYLADSAFPDETRLRLANYIGIPLILLTILLTMWQPSWLKPRWFRWLETHHSRSLQMLWEEARKEGWLSWNEKVKTQQGLEAWVAEVLYKDKPAPK